MKKISVTMTRAELIAGWIYLVLQLVAIPLLLDAANLLLGAPLSASALNLVYFCLNFICTAVIFRRFLIGNIKNTFTAPMRTVSSAVLAFLLYWLLSWAVSIYIQFVYPNFFNVNDDSIGELLLENRSLIAFGTIVLVPVTEELLYRGLVFRSIYVHNKLLAYLVSIIFFGALHVVGYIGRYPPIHLLLCFLQYLPAGICLGWAYARADSIAASILFHIFVNAIGILSM